MKFIWWTLVWQGLCIADFVATVLLMGGWEKYKNEVSIGGRFFIAITKVFLWIYLYAIFIK